MKDFVVYQKDDTLVYIHKGIKEKGHKLPWYGIRKNDSGGMYEWLGLIRFDGKWRQFVSEFAENTKWSAGCLEKIAEFERKITLEWRKKK